MLTFLSKNEKKTASIVWMWPVEISIIWMSTGWVSIVWMSDCAQLSEIVLDGVRDCPSEYVHRV